MKRTMALMLILLLLSGCSSSSGAASQPLEIDDFYVFEGEMSFHYKSRLVKAALFIYQCFAISLPRKTSVLFL